MTKEEKYLTLLKQMESLIVPEIPLEGNLCNLLGQLKKEFSFFWVGLYMRQGMKLGLGCFQGEPACTLIEWGRGVCGTAASRAETVIVDDVLTYPGYIACHPEPRSEIVVPGFIRGDVAFVLDVDSVKPADFDSTDKKYMEQAAELMAMVMINAKS